jgi:hypothetical protein
MLNIYEWEITCACPVDDDPDVYSMTVTSHRTIPVEEIIKAVGEVTKEKMFQEDLTQRLHRKINACVKLVGYHSGIKVTSIAGACQ